MVCVCSCACVAPALLCCAALVFVLRCACVCLSLRLCMFVSGCACVALRLCLFCSALPWRLLFSVVLVLPLPKYDVSWWGTVELGSPAETVDAHTLALRWGGLSIRLLPLAEFLSRRLVYLTTCAPPYGNSNLNTA